VLSAFFLEAGFLGIMLFRRERVGDRLHMFATAMTSLRDVRNVDPFPVNSWMQTPAGYGMNAGRPSLCPETGGRLLNLSFPTA
jgi:cytochrome d ubiquinol oxidase subunit I